MTINCRFTAGTYGEDSSNKTSYRTDGNTITVTAAGLKAYEGVTVRMDLNEGYWVDPINYDYMKWIIPFVLILVPLYYDSSVGGFRKRS